MTSSMTLEVDSSLEPKNITLSKIRLCVVIANKKKVQCKGISIYFS